MWLLFLASISLCVFFVQAAGRIDYTAQSWEMHEVDGSVQRTTGHSGCASSACPSARTAAVFAAIPGTTDILLHGGKEGSGNPTDSTWILHTAAPDATAWQYLPSAGGRALDYQAYASSFATNGYVFAYGGFSTSSDTVHIYRHATQTWYIYDDTSGTNPGGSYKSYHMYPFKNGDGFWILGGYWSNYEHRLHKRVLPSLASTPDGSDGYWADDGYIDSSWFSVDYYRESMPTWYDYTGSREMLFFYNEDGRVVFLDMNGPAPIDWDVFYTFTGAYPKLDSSPYSPGAYRMDGASAVATAGQRAFMFASYYDPSCRADLWLIDFTRYRNYTDLGWYFVNVKGFNTQKDNTYAPAACYLDGCSEAHPGWRENAGLAVVGNTIWLFGGERGILGDLFSIDIAADPLPASTCNFPACEDGEGGCVGWCDQGCAREECDDGQGGCFAWCQAGCSREACFEWGERCFDYCEAGCDNSTCYTDGVCHHWCDHGCRAPECYDDENEECIPWCDADCKQEICYDSQQGQCIDYCVAGCNADASCYFDGVCHDWCLAGCRADECWDGDVVCYPWCELGCSSDICINAELTECYPDTCEYAEEINWIQNDQRKWISHIFDSAQRSRSIGENSAETFPPVLHAPAFISIRGSTMLVLWGGATYGGSYNRYQTADHSWLYHTEIAEEANRWEKLADVASAHTTIYSGSTSPLGTEGYGIVYGGNGGQG